MSEIRIPGERGGQERLRRAREGVPVETSVLQELEELARESGLPYRPL